MISEYIITADQLRPEVFPICFMFFKMNEGELCWFIKPAIGIFGQRAPKERVTVIDRLFAELI